MVENNQNLAFIFAPNVVPFCEIIVWTHDLPWYFISLKYFYTKIYQKRYQLQFFYWIWYRPEANQCLFKLETYNSQTLNCFWYVHCTMGKFLPIFREGRYGPCCLLQLHLLAGKSITFLETKSNAGRWQKDLLSQKNRQNVACQQNCTSTAVRIFKIQCNCKASKMVTKGQLNSEWIYEVIVSPKIPPKNYSDFCPGSLLEGRTEILKIFGWHFWGKRWHHQFILNLTDL